ncbi:MAG: response regulator [Minisyncoccales bacterium]
MMNKEIILVVEDDKILADMYKDKLERSGFTVRSAFDAEEAIEAASTQKPDIILLDILLPGKSGIDFLEELKKNDLSNIPVIAFSNFDDFKTKKRAQELSVKEYLIKTDYTPKEIVEKVRQYLS